MNLVVASGMHLFLRFLARRVIPAKTKAAEDSRTSRPGGSRPRSACASASWSAAVLCRFGSRLVRSLVLAQSKSSKTPYVVSCSCVRRLCAALLLLSLLWREDAQADSVVTNCTQDALAAAIATGGTVTFTQGCSLSL